MTVAASKVARLTDALESTVLREGTDGAETSTAVETPSELPTIAVGHWVEDGLPSGQAEVIVNVTQIATDGDQAYTISLQVDSTADHSGTPIKIAQFSPIAVGSCSLIVDFDSVKQLLPGAPQRWLAVKCEMSGTSPSITYGATMGRVL